MASVMQNCGLNKPHQASDNRMRFPLWFTVATCTDSLVGRGGEQLLLELQ